MNNFLPKSSTSLKAAGLSALAVAAMSLSSVAHGQGYSTTFDDAGTFIPAMSLSGQDGWDTNDAFDINTNKGQADYVGPLNNYTPATNLTDNFAYLGGLGRSPLPNLNVEPGTSPVYLFRAFDVTGATAVKFDVDFSVASSTSTYANKDSFAWTFKSASGTLFSVDFVPSTTNVGSYAVRYTVGGVQTPSGNVIPTDSIFHLTVSVNVTSQSFGFAITGANTINVNNVNLATADPAFNAANSVTDVDATWILANPANSGSNALVFNNYIVGVPEPTTWAMLASGLLFVAVLARRRAQAA